MMQGLLVPHSALVPLGHRRGNPPASAIAFKVAPFPRVSSPTPRTHPLMCLSRRKLVIVATVPSSSMHPNLRFGLIPWPGLQVPGGIGGHGLGQQSSMVQRQAPLLGGGEEGVHASCGLLGLQLGTPSVTRM